MQNNNTKSLIIKIGGVRVGSKSRVPISKAELETLEKFIKQDPTPYVTIQHNISISRNTVIAILERKWASATHAIQLREFLKSIQKEGIV